MHTRMIGLVYIFIIIQTCVKANAFFELQYKKKYEWLITIADRIQIIEQAKLWFSQHLMGRIIFVLCNCFKPSENASSLYRMVCGVILKNTSKRISSLIWSMKQVECYFKKLPLTFFIMFFMSWWISKVKWCWLSLACFPLSSIWVLSSWSISGYQGKTVN